MAEADRGQQGEQRWKLQEGAASSAAYACVEAVHGEREVVVSLHGELDMGASPRLARELFDVLTEPVRAVVLELGDLTFIDSSGLGVLNLVRSQAMLRSIRLTLRHPPAPVRRVLELSGMDGVFDVEP